MRLWQRLLGARRDRFGEARVAERFYREAGPRRDGDPAAIVAKADRISKVLGWEPRLNDLDTIVGHALGWEKRLIEYRAAS